MEGVALSFSLKRKPGPRFDKELNVFGFDAVPVYHPPLLQYEQQDHSLTEREEEEEELGSDADIVDQHEYCMRVEGIKPCYNSSSSDDEIHLRNRRFIPAPPNLFPAVRKNLFTESSSSLQCNWPSIVPESISQALSRKNFPLPTPLQSQLLPVLLSGKDLLLVAPHKTGRTIAYAVPMLIHVEAQHQRDSPCAVVLASNKRRAGLIARKINDLSSDVRTVHVGTKNRDMLQNKGKAAVRVMVTTPLVFQELVQKKDVAVQNLSFCVLHDGDSVLANRSFNSTVSKLFPLMNPEKQVVVVSSTMASPLATFVDYFMCNAVKIRMWKDKR